MKSKISIFIFFLHIALLSAQTPKAFRYQAVLRDGTGTILSSKSLGLRVSLIKDHIFGVNAYIETHTTTSNPFGLVNLNIGKGNPILNNFADIDWSSGSYFIKIEIDPNGGTSYSIAGDPVQLMSVPYALFAERSNTNAKLEVVDKVGLDPDSALFEVKNKKEETVFAVYNNGAVLYVDDVNSKGGRGGFAVGGRTNQKGGIEDILLVTPDSVRFYVKENQQGKGGRGGFAVGGRTSVKGTKPLEFLRVTSDSTRILTKDPVAGFAIQDMAGSASNYLHIKPENMFIGKQAGEKTLGSYNSFFGHQTGMNNTTGAQNIFLGYQAGYTNSIGSSNIFLGPQSGFQNTQGAYNVFIGHNSGYTNATGHDNVFVGQRSGYKNLSGGANLFVGQNAGENNFSGTHNVFLGYETGKNNTGGTRNVYLGTQAGYSDSTGNYNVFIGNEAGFYEKGSNKLYIENSGHSSTDALLYGDFNSNELRMNAKVGINSDNSGYSLNIAGDINFNGQLYQNTIPYNPGLVKVELTENLSSPQPYSNPALGMLVFNTGANQPRGFYYWDGSQWLKIMSTAAARIACDSITNILGTSAKMHANIPSDGGGAILARGFCWNTSGNPTIAGSHSLDGTGVGYFSSTITGLTNFTSYKVRAYAQNAAGVAYSQEIQFNTGNSITLPILTTLSITNLTGTSATSGGTVSSTGGAAVSARGICWNTGRNPTIADTKTSNGTGAGGFSSALNGLSMGTTYYVRAYATNSAGTGYGDEIQFTTPNLPVVSTTAISGISISTATGGGNITYQGGGEILQRGVCWSSTQALPTLADSKTSDGIGAGIFSSVITSLSTGTIYHIRAYATNAAGTAYGLPLTFSTDLADIEGNTYKIVEIGTQYWTAENLKTTKLKDGTAIPLITDAGTWKVLSGPAYCWYNNDPISFKSNYGALYNWYTVNTNKLCPTNWHVPSDTEWKTMETFLGMDPGQADAVGYRGTDQGTQLKHTYGWVSGGNGSNSSGFAAFAGGNRYDGGIFQLFGLQGNWWSSTAVDAVNGWNRALNYNSGTVYRAGDAKFCGFSVRCIRD